MTCDLQQAVVMVTDCTAEVHILGASKKSEGICALIAGYATLRDFVIDFFAGAN
jgi:hypothetical protein